MSSNEEKARNLQKTVDLLREKGCDVRIKDWVITFKLDGRKIVFSGYQAEEIVKAAKAVHEKYGLSKIDCILLVTATAIGFHM